MPLPPDRSEDTPWPPPDLAVPLNRIREWSAWWGGDPDTLRSIYDTGAAAAYPRNHPSQFRGGIVGAVSRAFWGRPIPEGQPDDRLHIPLAGDIASVSAGLLFGDPAVLIAADPQDKATQTRLDQLTTQLQAPCLEATEAAAALGGVFLRAEMDTDVRPDPWLGIVHTDAAVPEFRGDILVAVTFWWTVKIDNNVHVRHLEHHAPGVVEHAVFEGTASKLGRRVDTQRHTQTAMLPGEAFDTRIKLLTAQYVPNMRPMPTWRNLRTACTFGRSDFFDCEPAFDAVDHAWSRLIREMDVAKARAIIPSSMLENRGVGEGKIFDPDRDYFTPVEALAVSGPAGGLPIAFSQPEIRVEEHLRIVQELVLRAISKAGYSAQSFGLIGEVAITATESANKREKSIVTTSRKGLYWTPPLAHMAQVLLQLGNRFAGWRVSDDAPTVQLAEPAMDPKVVAETIETLHRAEAISTETRVRRANPDFDDLQVKAETKRILAERTSVTADAFNADPDVPPAQPGADGAS